jgi:RecJ-like exonuclease
VNYPDLLNALKGINEKVDSLYICDLALNVPIIDELKRIRKSTNIVYIDHHPIKTGIQEELKKIGVKLIHSLNKCAGMLTYKLLEKELPEKTSILAAYATLSDYPTLNEEVFHFLQQFDPHLLAFEYSILYYAVAKRSTDNAFKHKIIEELSKLKYPHEIENVIELAREQVEYPIDLIRKTNGNLSSGKHLVYTEVSGSASVVANTLMHVTSKPTLICYKKNGDGTIYHLSIRSKDSNKHLGTLTSEIAKKVEGSGGGHPLAAGAQLPQKNFGKFITFLDNALK